MSVYQVKDSQTTSELLKHRNFSLTFKLFLLSKHVRQQLPHQRTADLRNVITQQTMSSRFESKEQRDRRRADRRRADRRRTDRRRTGPTAADGLKPPVA